MPLYQYRCLNCLHTWDEYRATIKDRDRSKCLKCDANAKRAHDLEIPIMRGDIAPRFDQSTGAYITSRADLREQLALHNAASDELPTNSYPSAGRLCKEERELLSNSNSSLFDKRKKPGWGSPVNVSGGVDSSEITVEGKADYQEVRDDIKKANVVKR
jgi:hypothetical protein